jgi:hypothetical protein
LARLPDLRLGQIFDSGSLTDSSAFYRQLCAQISESLELEPRVDELWNDGYGDNFNCTRYIEQAILPQAEGPVVLAIDEVDRIFASAFHKNFFGMLRSWHNKRAFSKLLRRLDMVLVASTEPQMYITDPLQSPFNVAEEIYLSDFSAEDVRALNARYWSPLDEDELGRLTDLVGGHPFLTHYAIYAVATNSISAERFFATATLDGGLFDDHLKHLLLKLFSAPELIECMREIVAGRICRDDRAFYRLSGAGLVRRAGSIVVPRCRLYADFFRDRL